MEKLEAVIQPTIGVLTHMGTAHDEGFESPAEKLEEKLKLFKNCKLLIYNYEALIDHKDDLKTVNVFPGAASLTWPTCMFSARPPYPASITCGPCISKKKLNV
jgi:hypothetical protein